MDQVFQRSPLNPILGPKVNNYWESKKLYNPGVIFHDQKYHLFYRAVGGGEDWQSAIGYAVSDDGENFQRFDEPLLVGVGDKEKRGLEDPRLTKIDNLFYMAYAAYDGITPRLNLATSRDLKHWQKNGPVFSDWSFAKAGGVYTKLDDKGQSFIKTKTTEYSKSGGIFPEKIAGKYLMIFGEYCMWFASSVDGVHWQGDQEPFLTARGDDYFDQFFVEMGPPPIKTEKGWLVLYHGTDWNRVYRIGYLLLDLADPRQIIYRSKEPIFGPEAEYEQGGLIDVLPGGLDALMSMSDEERAEFLAKEQKIKNRPKVVFCCGAVVIGDQLRIYYGAGDSIICTATASLEAILNYQ